MTTNTKNDIAIIGAGIIGLSSALRLQEAGYSVALLERQQPGMGASYGNASTIAPYGCIPVATPAIWKNLPYLLLSNDSPFSLRWRHLFRLMPWLTRFMLQTPRAKMQANARALSILLQHALEFYEPLLEQVSDPGLLQRKGCLYFYADRSNLEATAGEVELRRSLGIEQEILCADDVAAMEPALNGHSCGGIFFPDAAHFQDPLRFTRRLAEIFQDRGGQIICGEVKGLWDRADQVTLTTAEQVLRADQVVVAAGAWSRNLAAMAGDRIPLDTERGYHLEYPYDTCPVSRPCCPVESAFYLTPLAGRLRTAGTVELGNLRDGPRQSRLDYLQRHARELLPDLPEPIDSWLGHRPSMPDSLPVIGRSPSSPRVIYAFGHGHLGITLAGITAQLVMEIVQEIPPTVPLEAFRANRF